MDYFEILRPVILNTIRHICDRDGCKQSDVCARIREHLELQHKAWFGAEPDIDYEDPLCRAAYLYGHAAANANLCETAVRFTPALTQYVEEQLTHAGALRVCAFGGGPATELLGLCGWAEQDRRGRDQARLICTVMDRVRGWAESIAGLRGSIEEYFRRTYGPGFRDWPILPEANNALVDMTSVSGFANLADLFGRHDLYILNYVLSEMKGRIDAFAPVLAHIIRQAPLGARFLFIDRNTVDARRATSQLTDGALEMSPCHEQTSNLDMDHQKESLGELLAMVGRLPRVTWKAFWRVGIKTAD